VRLEHVTTLTAKSDSKDPKQKLKALREVRNAPGNSPNTTSNADLEPAFQKDIYLTSARPMKVMILYHW
jgi:hypothetical protein